MPFPFVYRVPRSIPDETLVALRMKMVQITTDLMKCKKEWVGPDFFRSALNDPTNPDEGCGTVLIKLETGLFDGRPDDDPQVQEVLKALTDAVWKAFGGKYEVEASVASWHPGWKFLRAPGQFDCRMPGCGGILSGETFPMQTGCHSYSPCRACTACGRVHSYDGDLMFGRAGHSPFLRDGEIELVLEPVDLASGKQYRTTSQLFIETGEDCKYDNLPKGKLLIFEHMDEETFCFTSSEEVGVGYRLHRGDVNFIEPI